MDKKQFTSWGVSFGSLALVAGMVSYLGLTNKNTTISNKPNQAQTASQGFEQQVPSQKGDNQNSFGSSNNDDNNLGDDQSTNDNGASMNDDGPSIDFGDGSSDDSGQATFDDGSSAQNNGQFSGRSFGHQGGFDTTTGGS